MKEKIIYSDGIINCRNNIIPKKKFSNNYVVFVFQSFWFYLCIIYTKRNMA